MCRVKDRRYATAGIGVYDPLPAGVNGVVRGHSETEQVQFVCQGALGRGEGQVVVIARKIPVNLILARSRWVYRYPNSGRPVVGKSILGSFSLKVFLVPAHAKTQGHVPIDCPGVVNEGREVLGAC